MTTPALAYKVKQYIDYAEMKKDVSFSPTDLTDAMIRQASLFAHYGVLAAQASRQVDDLKMLLETAEAAVSRRIRDEAATNNEKVTVDAVAALVARDPKILSIKKALNEAKQIEAVGKTAVEAFRHRRDMLVQQGAISREEMKGELSMQAKRVNGENMQDVKERFLASAQRLNREDS